MGSSPLSPAQDLVVLTLWNSAIFLFPVLLIIQFQIVSALMGEIKGLSAQNLTDVGDTLSSCPMGATAQQGWERGAHRPRQTPGLSGYNLTDYSYKLYISVLL